MDTSYNHDAKGVGPNASSVDQPSAFTAAPPTFELIGDLPDAGIEALARLLLSIHEDQTAAVSNEQLDGTTEVGQ